MALGARWLLCNKLEGTAARPLMAGSVILRLEETGR
jgi:hypothetical protein